MIIDEAKIVEIAKAKLPCIETVSTKITVVYVNDFEAIIPLVNRMTEIESPNGMIYIDNKTQSHYYYVVFQKMLQDKKFVWDLIGYDKRGVYNFNIGEV